MELKDKIFYLPIIILGIYFIIRLVNESSLIFYFPFDLANDFSSHMARLYFLAKYGFHNLVPNWYNGFNYILFESYPPGWFFFTLPLFYLIKDIQLTTYISLVLIYILLFLVIYFFLGKIQNLSLTKRFAFFVFFVGNPIAVGYLLRLGKLPELTGWLLSIIILGIVLWYKDHSIDKKFLFFIPLYSASLISNVSSFIVMSPFILSLILVKKYWERIIILISIITSLIISSFWWIPFYKSSLAKSLGEEAIYTKWLLNIFTVDSITTWITSILLILIFYLYWVDKNKSKRELIFFTPFLVLALLIFTRLIIFIPIYNRPPPDTFNIGFLLVSIFLFLKTRKFEFKLAKSIPILLLVLAIISVLLSLYYTPFFIKPSQLDYDTIELFPYVEGNYYIFNAKESYARAYYSYGAIYNDVTTISGWIDQILTKEDIKRKRKMINYFDNGDCSNFLVSLRDLNVKTAISYDDACNFFNKCKMTEKIKKGRACLFVHER